MAGLAIAGLGMAVAAPAATAGTGTACYESSCNNLDPTTSYNSSTGYECDYGATYPVGMPGETIVSGFLELRWGPKCGVNWARFTPNNNNKYRIYVETGGVNGEYYVFSNSSGVSRYSNQLYAPGPAKACVQLYTLGTWAAPICYAQPGA